MALHWSISVLQPNRVICMWCSSQWPTENIQQQQQKMRISAELFYYFYVVGKSNCRCYSSIIFTFFSALYQFPSRYNIFWSSALFTLDFSLIYSFFLLFSFMYFFFYIFFFLWHREREAQEALLALIYKTWPVCIGISTCLCGFISVFTCI